jgi:hypothetical protein
MARLCVIRRNRSQTALNEAAAGAGTVAGWSVGQRIESAFGTAARLLAGEVAGSGSVRLKSVAAPAAPLTSGRESECVCCAHCECDAYSALVGHDMMFAGPPPAVGSGFPSVSNRMSQSGPRPCPIG